MVQRTPYRQRQRAPGTAGGDLYRCRAPTADRQLDQCPYQRPDAENQAQRTEQIAATAD